MMKKKLLATAITAALASPAAFAQISYEASVDGDAGIALDLNDANPLIAVGSPSVIANDMMLVIGAATDVEDGDEVAIRLPTGFNFAPGTEPSFEVADPTDLLRLRDDAGIASTEGAVTLTDTNDDGMADLAVGSIAGANIGEILISDIEVVYSTAGTPETGVKNANVAIAGTSQLLPLIQAVEELQEPVEGLDVATAENAPATVTTTGENAFNIAVTVPANAVVGQTITVTLDSGLAWVTAPTALSRTPDAAPLTLASVTGSVATFELTADTTEETQYTITAADIGVTQQDALATLGATVAGTVGISGEVDLVELAEQSVDAFVDEDVELSEYVVVRGANTSVVVAPITITEVFEDNLGNGQAFTITAPEGVTITGAGGPYGGATTDGFVLTASGTTPGQELTFTVTDGTVGADSVVIDGITVTVDSSFTGEVVTLEVDAGTATNLSNESLPVAQVINRGAVEVDDPEEPDNIGPNTPTANPVSSTVTITEETYAALEGGNAADIIEITAPANVTIVDVTATVTGDVTLSDEDTATTTVYDADVALGGSSAAFSVDSESTAPSEIVLTVTYLVGDLAVGTDVEFTVSGSAGATGSAVVATVANPSTTSVEGAIPAIEPGTAEFSNAASVIVSETFDGSLDTTTGNQFRILAPTGVVFEDTGAAVAATATNGGSATYTVDSTFSVNDTLIVEFATPFTDDAVAGSVTVTPRIAVASGVSGNVEFRIRDAVLEAEEVGIVDSTVTLAFAGVVEDLEVGSNAVSLAAGYSVSNAITGGMAPYEVETSDEAEEVVTVTEAEGSLTITGVAAGDATITVTDALGEVETITVDVVAAGTQPATGNITTTDGSTSAATMTVGVTSDAGVSFGTEFTTADQVNVTGTINVDPSDIGEQGALFTVVRYTTPNGFTAWFQMDEDGLIYNWDRNLGSLMPREEVAALEATHTVDIASRTLPAGEFQVFLGYYSYDDGKLVYSLDPVEVSVSAAASE